MFHIATMGRQIPATMMLSLLLCSMRPLCSDEVRITTIPASDVSDATLQSADPCSRAPYNCSVFPYIINLTSEINEEADIETTTDYVGCSSMGVGADTDMNCTSKFENDTSKREQPRSSRGINPFDGAIITKARYDSMITIINYILFILCVIGIVFNGINVFIYTRPSMRSSVSIYLASLDSAALLYLIAGFPTYLMKILDGEKSTQQKVSLYMTIYLSMYLRSSLKRFYFCTGLALAIERLVAVSFPFRFKRSRSSKATILVVLVLFVIVMGVHSVNMLKFVVIPMELRSGGTIYILSTSNFYTENPGVYTGLERLFVPMFLCTPLAGIFLSDSLLMCVLYRHTKKQIGEQTGSGKFESAQKTNTKTTFMVLTCTMLIGVLGLPQAITDMVSDYLPNYGFRQKEHYLYLLLMGFGAICDVVGFCLDFLVYVSMSASYREKLTSIVCPQRTMSRTSNTTRRTRTSDTVESQLSNFSSSVKL